MRCSSRERESDEKRCWWLVGDQRKGREEEEEFKVELADAGLLPIPSFLSSFFFLFLSLYIYSS